MSGLGYLGLAYAVLWLGLGGYLWSLARRQRSLEKRIDEVIEHQRTPPT
ncbi:MAG TPA: CcmD family protein [Actinomycetota bacterium]|nr:CcmD family protein [Actinomycetota bacterium]